MQLRPIVLAVVLVAESGVARAQDTTTKLLPMVTVTRQAARSPYDLPFGITAVAPDSLRPGQAHVSADQTLLMIPGVTVANRTNPSQDVRVSVRGFGARSAFGVRSVRVLRDGMPLTLPDGQTPLDYLDLESVGRIEVIRGTASALYGNASGGIIDIHSTVPTRSFAPEARVWFGSDNLRRTTAVVGGVAGGMTYQGNIGQTEADNYRAYSRQKLVNGFGRLTTTVSGTDIALVGMALHSPIAENPGALTQVQYDTNPRMADPSSVTKKARKEVDQMQVGLSAQRQLGRLGLSAMGYGGSRSFYNPLTFAIVQVDRRTAGVSLRGDLDIAAVEGLRATVGGDYQWLDDERRNWANCNGVTTISSSCAVLGQEKGADQLNQVELVTGGGPYARLELERGRLGASAGLRADAIRFETKDRYLVDNSDDSGVRTLSAVSPMAGITFRIRPRASVYANYSTAFETPTTTELGNQPSGAGGFNPNLQPQQSRTVEVGTKGVRRSTTFEVSLFDTRVTDELIARTAANNRTYFENAGATRRKGIELATEWSVWRFELNASYSYSQFEFVDFLSGTTQVAGNQIPGIPEHQGQVSGVFRFSSGGFIVGELVTKSQIWANDANTVAARGFDVGNARIGRDFGVQSVIISPMVGVNNFLDRKYAGSVAINAAGSATTAKVFEPAAGRTWIAGARVQHRR